MANETLSDSLHARKSHRMAYVNTIGLTLVNPAGFFIPGRKESH
ncbi:hypothetical protein [Galactobacillus timonensis]|nr:hypothetical protein [Galactobacillus timonensis]